MLVNKSNHGRWRVKNKLKFTHISVHAHTRISWNVLTRNKALPRQHQHKQELAERLRTPHIYKYLRCQPAPRWRCGLVPLQLLLLWCICWSKLWNLDAVEASLAGHISQSHSKNISSQSNVSSNFCLRKISSFYLLQKSSCPYTNTRAQTQAAKAGLSSKIGIIFREQPAQDVTVIFCSLSLTQNTLIFFLF